MAPLQVNVPALLELLRRRRRAEKSLQERLIGSIADTVDWIDLYTEGEIKLDNLPLPLRKEVLRKLTGKWKNYTYFNDQKHIDRIITAYSQLICPKIKKIVLDGLINNIFVSLSENVTKVLEVISNKAVRLEQLDLIITNSSTLCPIDYQFLDNNSIDAILRMENLKVIRMRSAEYRTIKRLCKNLKNLQHVECEEIDFSGVEDLEADIEDVKSSFSRLRVFWFLFSYPKHSFAEMLIKHLPNLNVVKDFADNMRFFSTHEWPIPEETSKLRHLYTAPTTNDLPTAFPNVTHLKANCSKIEPKDQLDSILKFPSIESLALCTRRSSTLNSFLEAYGANLHTLIIEISDWQVVVNLSFERIFDACPKLQKLMLHDVTGLDDKKPLKSFGQLRELEWQPQGTLNNTFQVTNILAAPNLRKVSLYCDHNEICVKDLRKLTSLVAEKKILCELTNLSWNFCAPIEEEDKEINVEFLKALRDFVAVAAVHLPNLVDFNLQMNFDNCPGSRFYLQSDLIDNHFIFGVKFEQWIGDDSIAEFLRALYERKPCPYLVYH